MTDTAQKELKVKEKQEVATPAEQTRPGIVFSPNVDIYETDQKLMLLADLPGVRPEDLTVDLRDDVLTISGEVQPFEGPNEKDILIEYEIGKYYRQFTLSEVIDQGRIDAQLKDGVLQLTLPKVEKAAPRTIKVAAG
ncbi:Hsp20/alpha crystallin family protein [Desulfatitalea tepidiphila]|jgi:HSP20 family molecular chaperone IbpA|uniref:Hsp20/alpha crystallin family protein n=1 Tax=Desulfatitalea tepidiphila TaxID=1185843 RepID=UPI0006B4026A|nr:Hsp20/alpha crystallin family protein [Desulfatitalea tepidiphila]